MKRSDASSSFFSEKQRQSLLASTKLMDGAVSVVPQRICPLQFLMQLLVERLTQEFISKTSIADQVSQDQWRLY